MPPPTFVLVALTHPLAPLFRYTIMHLVDFARWRRLGAAALVTAALAAAGCARAGKVSGTVTLWDGKPLPAGRIYFKTETASEVAEIVDGQYTVNAPLGPCRVALETSHLAALGVNVSGGFNPDLTPQMRAEMERQKKAQPGAGEGIDKMKELAGKYVELPEAYTDPATSGLALTVAKGGQEYNIGLTKPQGWEPGRRGPAARGQGAFPGGR